VGCFTGTNVWRYFNRQLKLTPSRVTQKEDDILRCFEAARDENFDIFALTKTKRNGNLCLSGKDAKKNLNRYQEGSDCKNGLGGQNNNFDIYLVPGRAISGIRYIGTRGSKGYSFQAAFVYHLISKSTHELFNGCLTMVKPTQVISADISMPSIPY